MKYKLKLFILNGCNIVYETYLKKNHVTQEGDICIKLPKRLKEKLLNSK